VIKDKVTTGGADMDGVGVVIPARNEAKAWLLLTVDSVLKNSGNELRRVIVVDDHSTEPVDTWPEWAAYVEAAEARRRPGELSYASFGIGSASHLYGAMLEQVADVRMVHVPYRGSSPAVLDVVAGNAFLSINDEAVTVPQVRDGRLLPLAVTGPARIDTLPEVPTFVELGYRGGLELLGYNGLVLRAGTPPALVERLAGAILPVLRTAEGRTKIRELGLVPTALGPAEFAAQMRADAPVWAAAARASGARVE
jgi:tripartite-type tricarboxylate transporter receptor subunit TctC